MEKNNYLNFYALQFELWEGVFPILSKGISDSLTSSVLPSLTCMQIIKTVFQFKSAHFSSHYKLLFIKQTQYLFMFEYNSETFFNRCFTFPYLKRKMALDGKKEK